MVGLHPIGRGFESLQDYQWPYGLIRLGRQPLKLEIPGSIPGGVTKNNVCRGQGPEWAPTPPSGARYLDGMPEYKLHLQLKVATKEEVASGSPSTLLRCSSSRVVGSIPISSARIQGCSLPYKDINKRREAGRKSYAKHKEKARIRMRAYMKNSRVKKRELARRYALLKGCYVCGYRACHRALCFHHVDPATKRRCVATMASENYGMKTFKEEIRKCVVLCANHHAGVHEGLIELDLK